MCWPHTRYPIPGLTPSPDFHDLSQNCSPASLSSQGGDFTLLRDALLWENYGTCGIFFYYGGGCQLNSHLHFSTDSGVSTTLLPRLSMKERTWECFNPQPPPAPVIKKVNQIPIDSTNHCWRGWGEWVGGWFWGVGQVGWDRIPTLNKNSFATNLKILMLRFWSAL